MWRHPNHVGKGALTCGNAGTRRLATEPLATVEPTATSDRTRHFEQSAQRFVCGRCAHRDARRGGTSLCRRSAVQYPATPRLVLVGGEDSQTVVAVIIATEAKRKTSDRILEPDPGDQDMLHYRLGDHAGMSVPQPITQGCGTPHADQREIRVADDRGPEILHEQAGGQPGNVEEVWRGHQDRLREAILSAELSAHGRRQMCVRDQIMRIWIDEGDVGLPDRAC